MVGRDSFFYGDPEDNGFQSSPESDPKENLYNSADRPSTMGQQYPYPFPKPEIYTPIDKTIPLDPRKTTNSKTYTHYRRERERALSKLSVNSLVQRLINEEDRTQKAKSLLRTAISHLEAATERANRAEKARKVMEDEHRAMQTNQTIRGLKATEGVLNAQKETAKAQEELGLYKLQLQHAEREVRRAQTVVRTVEDEREDALRAAKKAKEFARKMNEEKLMLIAREEGRKEGFEEGMRQGHLLAITSDEVVAPRRRISDRAHATPVGSGAAFIEEYEEDEDSSPIDRVQQDERSLGNDFNRLPDMSRGIHNRSRQHRTPRFRRASLDSTPRGRSTISRSIPTHSQPQTPHRPPSTVPASNASVVDETLRQELEAARRDRDAADAQRREVEQREQIRQWHERQEKAEREKEQKALLERERAKEAELDREREAIRAKDAERDREIEAIRQRDRDREAERTKELEALKKEREEREREREQDREREREREREEARQRDLATAAQTAAASRVATNLPYLPMPPPPIQVVVQAPPAPPPVPPPAQAPVIPPPPVVQTHGRHQSQQFQPSHRRQRSSPDTRSPSSSTTGISQLDIVTFPTGMSRREDRDRDRDLSDIPEDPSIRSQSRASEAQPTPPSWVNDPPVDYTTRGNINQWRYSSSSHSPSNTPTALSPLENTYLSPTFQPRGRGTERRPSSDYRRASSGSSNSYNFIIQPPSRPASRPQEPDVERQGFLSPNHTPRALAPEPPPVIAPSEIYVVPPPGFVAFQSPNTGHANLNGSGSNPPNGNIYSNWGTPSSGSPNTKPVPLRTHDTSSSGTRRTDTPPSHIPYHPHQPPRPIYAPTPPSHVRPLGGASEPPVIPPPFLHMAPRQPRGGGATPGPYHRSLPGRQSTSTPRSGGRIPSDSSVSSSGSYSGPNRNAHDDPWVDGESPPDPATQRNTLVNAASTAGALPIPPPSFSRHRY